MMTGRLAASFPRVVVERSGVLPLLREAEGRRRGNVEDLVLRLRVGLRELDAEAVEQGEVRPQLGLRRRLGLEVAVTGLPSEQPVVLQVYVSYCALKRGVLPAVPCDARRRKSVMCGTFQNGSSDTRHTPETRPNGAQRLPAPNSELPS